MNVRRSVCFIHRDDVTLCCDDDVVPHPGNGAPFSLETRNANAVDALVKEKGMEAVFDYIMWLFGTGYGDVEQNDNGFVPGWKPLTYEEAVQKYY